MDNVIQFKSYVKGQDWLEAKSLMETEGLSLSKDEEVLKMVGLVYYKLYYFKAAEDIFIKLKGMDSNNIDYLIGLAEVFIAMKSYDKAYENIMIVLELDKKNIQANRLLFKIQKEQKKGYDLLIQQLEKIIKLEASEEDYCEMASLLYENNSYEACINYCNKIMRKYRRGAIVQKIRNLYHEADKANKALKVQEEKEKIKKETIAKIEKKKMELPEELKPLEKFTGMEELKHQIIQITNTIQFEKKRRQRLGVQEEFIKGNHFVITGKPGTGKTTIARALCQIFNNIGLIKEEKVIEVDRKALVGQYIGETEKKTKEKIDEALGGILFVDEAYALYKPDSPKDFGKDAIEVLMKEMEDKRTDFIVIAAGYKKEMDVFFESNPGLQDRFNHRIHIPDYSNDELVAIAEKVAYEQYYLISNDAKKALVERIQRERVEENFSNARFVRKLVEEGMQNFASRMVESNTSTSNKDDLIILEAVDFNSTPMKSPEEEIQAALDELNNLVGLSQVKEQVNSVINQIQVHQQRKKMGLKCIEPSLHMLFIGNPGTGKTTVAKLVGRIYKALGVLKKGDRFEECTREDFVSSAVGETAIKTQKKIRSALGGILFIDEAYELYQGEKDSFGKEAIGVLIKEMEDRRDNLMVIMAGYKKEMEMLLSANSGFESRINTTINFEDYTTDELLEIFKKMCASSDMIIGGGALDKLEAYIEGLYQSKKQGFGNGREVRNIFERIIKIQNNRIAKVMADNKPLSKDDLMRIEVEDLLLLQ